MHVCTFPGSKGDGLRKIWEQTYTIVYRLAKIENVSRENVSQMFIFLFWLTNERHSHFLHIKIFLIQNLCVNWKKVEKEREWNFAPWRGVAAQVPWDTRFVDDRLGTDALPKADVVLYLQRHANSDWLRLWRLSGKVGCTGHVCSFFFFFFFICTFWKYVFIDPTSAGIKARVCTFLLSYFPSFATINSNTNAHARTLCLHTHTLIDQYISDKGHLQESQLQTDCCGVPGLCAVRNARHVNSDGMCITSLRKTVDESFVQISESFVFSFFMDTYKNLEENKS